MSGQTKVNLQELGVIADAVDAAGEELRERLDTVTTDTVDAGASTSILNTVFGHIVIGTTALLEELDSTQCTVRVCAEDYATTEQRNIESLCAITDIGPRTPQPNYLGAQWNGGMCR
ncbi:hypothetical protein [Actinokineospora sp. UTMC 2448]|uniref:hypothetical protein n=1 Tax=Actinokineospora sp. UTMC 2448 TaxID=2268449 RepID=UPI0021641F9F|nr:hypothetical protein [Actinokineospora sp. UTMC 2448]UVS78408.1 hypothetical protein Actkin_02141 [Actinokineospora sp. UTMC 2448]